MNIYEALDLTEGEKKVYSALVELKSTTTGPIYQHAGVSQSKVYEILKRLKDKGLASHIIKGNITHWQPANPQIYLDKVANDLENIKQRKQVLEKELPTLVKSNSFTKEDVAVFEEFNGFKNALTSFQESFSSRDELLVFSSPKNIQEPYLTFLNHYTKERVRRNVHARVIYGKGMKEFSSELHGTKKTEIRFVDIVTPSTIGISPDRVMLMNWGQKPKFIVLSGKDIVQSYHSFFESFWKIAKK